MLSDMHQLCGTYSGDASQGRQVDGAVVARRWSLTLPHTTRSPKKRNTRQTLTQCKPGEKATESEARVLVVGFNPGGTLGTFDGGDGDRKPETCQCSTVGGRVSTRSGRGNGGRWGQAVKSARVGENRRKKIHPCSRSRTLDAPVSAASFPSRRGRGKEKEREGCFLVVRGPGPGQQQAGQY